jgi:PAS domain S-box-containing protein
LVGTERMSSSRQIDQRPLRVLLVEDNPDDALLLALHLTRSGYDLSIKRVETGEEMSQALADPSDTWDIILADYNLPAFSAPRALQLLKSTGFDMPFIVLSGAVSEDTAVEAMRAGAHDYISKQNLVRLVPAIEREIGEAEARRNKRATERALRQSEDRFHKLVEAMPLGLLLSDSEQRIVYGNSALLKLLGYRKGDIENGAVTFDQIFVQDPLVELQVGHSQNDPQEPVELSLRTREGAVVPALVGTAVLNPEAPLSERQTVAFLADLTDQKRGQDVLRRTEKLAAAGRLAASIAHEINNPLEAVINCLYLIAQTSLDKDGAHYLELAQRELERVVHITTQTLRFYRQNSRPIKTDIHELLETVLTLWEGKLRNLGIAVERRFGRIPAIVAYDGEVRQVLANLIGNAVDAMQNQGGKLILRTAPAMSRRDGTPGIAITIADSGSGMTPDTLGRIFEPFFSTKGLTGTGLGLWVSRELVKKHHGALSVRSTSIQPSGTTFRLFLPLTPPELGETRTLSISATV